MSFYYNLKHSEQNVFPHDEFLNFFFIFQLICQSRVVWFAICLATGVTSTNRELKRVKRRKRWGLQRQLHKHVMTYHDAKICANHLFSDQSLPIKFISLAPQKNCKIITKITLTWDPCMFQISV